MADIYDMDRARRALRSRRFALNADMFGRVQRDVGILFNQYRRNDRHWHRAWLGQGAGMFGSVIAWQASPWWPVLLTGAVAVASTMKWYRCLKRNLDLGDDIRHCLIEYHAATNRAFPFSALNKSADFKQRKRLNRAIKRLRADLIQGERIKRMVDEGKSPLKLLAPRL